MSFRKAVSHYKRSVFVRERFLNHHQVPLHTLQHEYINNQRMH